MMKGRKEVIDRGKVESKEDQEGGGRRGEPRGQERREDGRNFKM